MQKLKQLFSVMLITAMVLGTQIMIEASSATHQIINLPSPANIYTYKSVTRSLNYSYVEEKLNGVYLTNGGGIDNYVYVKTGIFLLTNPSVQISRAIVTLSETSTGNTKVYVKEGYLAQKTVYIGFGNYYNGVSLTADVNYDGK